MKILVTGSTGMLGTSVCRVASKKGYSILGISRGRKPRILFPGERHWVGDVGKKEDIFKVILEEKPEAIVHTAAVADVDLCERQPALAEAVNATSSDWIAKAAGEIGALLCYVSTDYVFDGKGRRPYQEEDAIGPVNVYARTKVEGERAVQSGLPSFYIARTSWLFGEGRDSFVHHILTWAEAKAELQLVNDKWSIPSYTLDVAAGILALIEKKPPFGIYHLSNGGGGCSWQEYGAEVLRQAGLSHVKTKGISLSELKLAAPRPPMTVLEIGKFKREVMVLRDWRKALGEYFDTVVPLARRRG